LDFDERRSAAGHARLVEAARAATLAVGDLHQIAWDYAFGNGELRCEKAVAERPAGYFQKSLL